MARPSAFVVALLLALAITALWWQLAEKRARTAEARLAALGDSLRAAARQTPPPDRRAGGSDSTVIADLARHPELIPFAGMEGGTMRFYPSECRVVAAGWAYGYFEDGHIAGSGLFEYQAARDGRLRWKRLAARLE